MDEGAAAAAGGLMFCKCLRQALSRSTMDSELKNRDWVRRGLFEVEVVEAYISSCIIHTPRVDDTSPLHKVVTQNVCRLQQVK